MAEDRSTPDAIAEIRKRWEGWKYVGKPTTTADYIIVDLIADLSRLLTLLDVERARSAEQEKEIERLKGQLYGDAHHFGALRQVTVEIEARDEYRTRAEAAEQHLAQKDAELTALRALTTALVKKIDAVAADPQFQAMAVIAHVHGMQYTGPNWAEELTAVKAVLPREDQERAHNG